MIDQPHREKHREKYKKKRFPSIALISLALLLSGCQPAGSHIPELWQLPGAAIGNAIGNAVYDSRREKVATYVQQHYWLIRSETIADTVKTHTQQAARLAGANAAGYRALVDDLAHHTALYFPASIPLSATPPSRESLEPLVVAIMVHGR